MDYPREEIMQMAEEAIMDAGGPDTTEVYFKFTCVVCGTRCTFSQPNTLYQYGDCFLCGNQTKVDKAGYMLVWVRK
jgi:hypothetical protein